MIITNYKHAVFVSITILLTILLIGYSVFYMFYSLKYANAFCAGFIIILCDLFLIARYLFSSVKQVSVTGFLLQSVIRWAFVGFCIYFALVVLDLYTWSFALGIILPFVGVVITGIYQIIRGKEDGTSS